MGVRVLVTGASLPAARSMLHALHDEPVTLLACDCEPVTRQVGDAEVDQRFRVHDSDCPEFVGDLVSLCVQHQVDVLVPMRESDQIAIMPVRRLFEQLGARVWLAPIPPAATRSQARRIVNLGARKHARPGVVSWIRRMSRMAVGAAEAPAA